MPPVSSRFPYLQSTLAISLSASSAANVPWIVSAAVIRIDPAGSAGRCGRAPVIALIGNIGASRPRAKLIERQTGAGRAETAWRVISLLRSVNHTWYRQIR